ncbi:MFS transporter [Sulfodiicoccus acidiphilus]|uniref:MFS transporter n=1 Tax=Sulfodiicoccus acidiphilus TaxID=1670455 RepID=A0A348B619_9CREN|nr:MFS transporter [Sulfodiicoccus acidiphilus]BBD73621.1 MFS transporter [Sulfodiicoccus acidiphilus]GGU04704.1 MFS transporter [Sulfodiicoccus acidiphilus]
MEKPKESVAQKGKIKSIVGISVIAFLAWTISVYDYILFGNMLPVMQSYFHWTDTQSSLLATLVSIGILLVSFTVGPMIDRFGRVKAIAITTAGVAISSLLTGIAGLLVAPIAFVWIAVVRAFSGFGYSEQAANSAYLTEIYKEKVRGTIYSFVQGGWPIGVLLGSAFIILLLGKVPWYAIFWFATIPAVVVALLALFLLPETERYFHIRTVRAYIKAGKVEEAKSLMDKYKVDIDEAKKMTYGQLFSSKLRKHTTFLSLSFLTNWMGIEVFVVLITLVLTTAKGISFTSTLTWLIIANALSYIGYVAHGILGDRIGRRDTILMGWIVAGLAGIGMMLAPSSDPLLVEILYVITLFFIIGPYSALFSYMGESFPTRARGTGVAFVNAMGPIGGLAGAGALTAILASGASMTIAAILAGGIPTLASGLLLLGARRIRPGMKLEDISY